MTVAGRRRGWTRAAHVPRSSSPTRTCPLARKRLPDQVWRADRRRGPRGARGRLGGCRDARRDRGEGGAARRRRRQQRRGRAARAARRVRCGSRRAACASAWCTRRAPAQRSRGAHGCRVRARRTGSTCSCSGTATSRGTRRRPRGIRLLNPGSPTDRRRQPVVHDDDRGRGRRRAARRDAGAGRALSGCRGAGVAGAGVVATTADVARILRTLSFQPLPSRPPTERRWRGTKGIPHMTRIAINGFGRIGRNVLRALLERDTDLEVVAVNDLTDPKALAQLLALRQHRRPARPPRRGRRGHARGRRPPHHGARRARPGEPAVGASSSVDIVLESTGRFTAATAARAHLDAGARKVLVERAVRRRRRHPRVRREHRRLRPGRARDRLERLVHDERARAAGRRCSTTSPASSTAS